MDERDQRHLEAVRDSANLAREHAASGGPNWKESMLVVDATWKRVEEVGLSSYVR
jgi:hypothetical protein